MISPSIKSRIIFSTWMTLIAHWAIAEDTSTQSVRQNVTAPVTDLKQSAIGRPVRIVSFSFPKTPSDEVLKRIDQEGASGADLIILPEIWRGGQTDDSMESLDGPTTQMLSAIAKKHNTYILSPIDAVVDGTKRRNSAVLIDRQGRVAGAYDKAYPFWSELEFKHAVEPGANMPVFETDFGKLGVTICFDANFPEVWQRLADAGAELVVWTSAYSAGEHLKAYALLHHYYIVTSTWTGDCQVYDITGRRIVDEKSPGIHVTRTTLDLDRGIYHENYNLPKRDQLLKERAGEVVQEDYLTREGWFVLTATKPGISARQLAKKYGMEELRDFVNRSRQTIDDLRGPALTTNRP